MAMHEYEVEIRGITHTFQIDDEDLDRYPGARRVKGSKEVKPVPEPVDEQVGRSPASRDEAKLRAERIARDGVDPADDTEPRSDDGQVQTSPQPQARSRRRGSN